ncbi:ABC transporter substrate-binding protein [Intrasporangium sp. DVR]|uniref:ABC transporter substrate-binding protein n=1 Tax=Intrasporangium sp. DVR TaxID=3127867 RepID=UPI00313A58B8
MKFTASKKTLAGALVALGTLAAVPALSANAAPAPAAAHVSQSRHVDGAAWTYHGTWEDKQGRSGHAVVKLQPQEFFTSGDSLMMRTLVTTTLDGARGSQPHSKMMNLEIQSLDTGGAATSTQLLAASCDILNLDLGPLDLNVLGLTVHLDQVVLDIVAESGAGNLLGNLLCAVAGLLDGVGDIGVLDAIAGLLNQILGIINGLGGNIV